MGEEIAVDVPLDSAQPRDFDALLLPGGIMNPDALRMQAKAIAFVPRILRFGKTGGSDLPRTVDGDQAGAARGRRIASWPSIKTDLRNAGAEWVDQEAVVDGNLVSSRKP